MAEAAESMTFSFSIPTQTYLPSEPRTAHTFQWRRKQRGCWSLTETEQSNLGFKKHTSITSLLYQRMEHYTPTVLFLTSNIGKDRLSFPNFLFCSVQFSSVTQSRPTLCDSMNRSTPGLPVHHKLPEFTQTHVHWVADAIQPSHPLSSPSLPAPSPSQHQGLFQWVNSSHEVTKVLEFQLQHQSFQWTPRTDLL